MLEDFDDFSFDDQQLDLNKTKIAEVFSTFKSVHSLPSHLPAYLSSIPQANPFLYKDFAGLPPLRCSSGRVPEILKNLQFQIKNLKEQLPTLLPLSSVSFPQQDDVSFLEKLIGDLDKEREEVKKKRIGLEEKEKGLIERERLLAIEKEEISSKNDHLKEIYKEIEDEKEFLNRSKHELESQNAELIAKNNDFLELEGNRGSIESLQKDLVLEKNAYSFKTSELLQKINDLQKEKADLNKLKQELDIQKNDISTQIDELSLQKIELDHEKSSLLLQKQLAFDLHQQELEKPNLELNLELTLQKESHLSSPLPTKKKEDHQIEEELAHTRSTRRKVALEKLIEEGQNFILASSVKKTSKKISKREVKQKEERERSEKEVESEIKDDEENEGKEDEGYNSPSPLPPSSLLPPPSSSRSSSKLKFSSASKFLKKSIFEGLKYIHENDEEEKMEINNLEKEAVGNPELINELMIKPFLLEKRIERRRKEGEEGKTRRKKAEGKMKKKLED